MKITKPTYALMCDPEVPCWSPGRCYGKTVKELLMNCL